MGLNNERVCFYFFEDVLRVLGIWYSWIRGVRIEIIIKYEVFKFFLV